MNKNEILDLLNKYNFDKNNIIILSGAAMVINGVKDITEDIDLAVSKDYEKKLLQEYNCMFKEKNKNINVYKIDDKIEFGTNYFDFDYEIKYDYKIQTLNSIIKLKENLNRSKDIKDIKLIKDYLNNKTTNSLALAYLGDAIYEVYIRKYLLSKGIIKVNELQQQAINYVSAKAQSNFLEKMINDNFLKEEELTIIKRARNHKSHSSKSADIITYKKSTGLEALIGYLDLKQENKRIEEIMKYIVGE